MPALSRADAVNLFRQAPDRFLDVGAAGELAYRRVGTGPDVLFVHGWPVSGATFRGLLPFLADQVTCHVIDLPGAGASRFSPGAPLSIDGHIAAVRTVVDLLGLNQVAAVGHDSGGLIARHALAGDPRLRAMGLIDTEQPQGLNWRFKAFLAARHLPAFGAGFAWALGRRTLRRNDLVLGGAFADKSLLDGEFDELFLAPLRSDLTRRDAAISVLDSFSQQHVRALAALHDRITVPVQLVWGADDPFFPVAWAREMAGTFADGRIEVIEGARLFSHEEKPEAVSKALLAVLAG
ncbi:MAG: alpha/beta hydrolase [Acidimicrobiia bacterium]|nr:alpha/beta hydrolase [Acidimicrobiia bacterium]MDH4364410.1 alpha/beta hydrolase [Acidimicrobiia bacterium]MDH5288462.1 alpha/beta hydrolase [Acidimicrobiia bacterium]